MRRWLMVGTAVLACACATTSPAAKGHAGKPQLILEPAHREPELVATKHVVEKGQTLFRIARTYDLTVEELMAANGIDDPRELRVGEELVVPGSGAPLPVAATDSPEPLAPGRPVSEKRERGPVAVGRKDGVLQWPVRGVLYARFGKKGKEAHDGIDLAAPAGTPVQCAGPGTVLFAGEQKGYGLIAIIEHAGGLITLYAHNRDLRVKAGQTVREKQVVATVGDSGATSGPHLHFEVRKDGVPVDPLEFLGPVPRQ